MQSKAAETNEGIEQLTARVRSTVEADLKKLSDVILPLKDPTLTVLQFHLLAEGLLERLLVEKLPRADLLVGPPHLSFAVKLRIVASLAVLDDATVHSLRKLNRLRNECAHRPGRVIALEDIDTIGRPFGRTYSAVRTKTRGYAAERDLLLANTLMHLHSQLLSKVLLLELEPDFERINTLGKSRAT